MTTFDGRRTFDELTPGRAAGWGAVAGAAFPAGTVWVAKRAPDQLQPGPTAEEAEYLGPADEPHELTPPQYEVHE